MTRTLAKTLVALGFIGNIGCMMAHAQDPPPPFPGWSVCIDPDNTMPYSVPYFWQTRANDLFRATIGGPNSTVTYFGGNSPCGTPSHTYNVDGRIGFMSGPTGSVQSTADDDMLYTFGMPHEPAGTWSYATTRSRDPNTGVVQSTLFGSALSGLFFSGASGRYEYMEQTAGGIHTTCRVDVVGDGARVNWTMTNVATTPQQLGIWYGAQMALMDNSYVPGTGSGLLGAGPVFITMPGRKPLLVDTRIIRSTNPSTFPPFVQFCFGQTTAYGLQVDLGPTDATSDPVGNSDATNVDELVVGTAPFVTGNPISDNNLNTMPDFIFGDVTIGGGEQFIMKYEPQTAGTIAVNSSRNIISYYRNTWGNSKYTRPSPIPNRPTDQPYTTVIDAPHILTQDDGTGTNGLANNPFTVRAYIDNVGGYSDVYTSVQLNDVHVTLNLPPGMSMSNGDNPEKIISVVNPLEIQFVDWQVQSDGIEIGDLPYTVTITSTPGPPHPITHNGIIRVSATKQVKLEPSANLISTPWVYTDSSWETVFGMNIPNDFTAYDWDPVQNGYVVSPSAKRGVGTWIILNPATHPTEEVDPVFNASTPTDMQTGAANEQLHAGWNLIGDPYPYAIPVSQLVGVSAANPAQSFLFADLVSQNVLSPYIAYWDTTVNNYRYVQGINAIMQPNKGYWVQLLTSQDLTLNFPPIWDTFIPGGRSADPGWVQTPNHWRLNLQARTGNSQDNENYIGVATGSQARFLQIGEPPQGPTQGVSLTVDGSIGGHQMKLAQSISDHTGSQSWHMSLYSKGGGLTTVSWPNMSTLPANLTFRLVDSNTGQGFDMRSRSSISVQMGANTTRQFQVQTSVSGTGGSIISSVSPGAGRISTRTPVTLVYGLTVNATTTVRVLDGQGNEMAVLRNHEAAYRGSNTGLWNLKNENGSYVAPGVYQIEVSAIAGSTTATRVANVTVQR